MKGYRMKRPIHKPSPATIIVTVALFFSLGGVGIAATGYRITSIFQIAPKVRHALHGAQGPVGPQGLVGPSGPQGAPGTTMTTYLRQSAPVNLTTADAEAQAIVSCRSGDRVLSGGYVGSHVIVTTEAPISPMQEGQAEPAPVASSEWAVEAHLDTTSASGELIVWALCVS